MLDSETISHATPGNEQVDNYRLKKIPIYLSSKSFIKATLIGEQNKDVQVDEWIMRASLSIALFVSLAPKILLLVPVRLKDDIAVLFMPSYASLLYTSDDFRTLAYAHYVGDEVLCLYANGNTPWLVSARYHVNRLCEMIANHKQQKENAVNYRKLFPKAAAVIAKHVAQKRVNNFVV